MEPEQIELFGGLVLNARTNTGWGSQSSNAQVDLVYDKDGPLSGQDYSKNFPEMGTCVGLKIGELKFAGLFQRYGQQRSLDGYKYNIVIESPSRALDGVQVILDTFQGSNYFGMGTFTNQVNNVWNPFAIRENFNYGGIFGGSNVNSLGFPGYECFTLLEEISRGEHAFGGKIKYGNTEFELDLTEVKQLLLSIPNYHMYRIKGPVQTLSSILDDVCSLLMHDYVVTVEPKNGSIENGVIENAVIKIRLVDKSRPPDQNVIKQIVNKLEADQKLISADLGKELNDAVTQKVVVGGPATRYATLPRPVLSQIWGRTKNVMPQYTENIVLDNGMFYPPNIMEVRCAMHSFDSWVLFHVIRRYLGIANNIVDRYANLLFTNVRIDEFVINRIATGKASAIDFMDSTFKSAQQKNEITVGKFLYEDLEKIHNSIKSAGEEYWGRKYFVYLPQEPGGIANNIKFIQGDYQYINSWEIADSAWAENTQFQDISFYDGEGKLKPTATWNFDKNNNDYTNLGNGYCFTSGGGIASVINLEKDIIWKNGSPACVVELPAVQYIDVYTTQSNGLAWLLNIYFGYSFQQLAGLFTLTAESGTNNYGIAPMRVDPINVGVPQQSTRYRWGPWWNYKGLNGKAEFILEDSLTPETYGGRNGMSDVGLTYAAVVNAEVSGRESGSIETYGIPESNVAERFLRSGPYVSSMSVNYSISGFTTSYTFNTWTPEFGKLAKFNADRFSTINKNMIAFMQNARSKFEKRPFAAPQYKDAYLGKFSKNLFGLNAGLGFAAMGLNVDPEEPKEGDDENQENLEQEGENAQPQPKQIKKRTIAAFGNPQTQIGNMSKNFKNTYGCSIEQIFSPVASREDKKTDTDGPELQKPDTDENLIAPTAENYDPYFTQSNDFTLAIHGEEQNANTDLNLNNPQNVANKPKLVRTMGFRGPMLLSGWGRGIDMKAAPYDSEADQSERFTQLPNIGQQRHLWKTGPVDLRWDEERKTWGAGFDFIEGILETDVTEAESFEEPTEFTVNIARSSHFIELEGAKMDNKVVLTGETIKGMNRDKSLALAEGSYVVCLRINYEWRIIFYSCN